jgi:hypothetical protein
MSTQEYDLSKIEDVLAAGGEFGLAWTDGIRRIVDAIEGDDLRIAFFAAVLGGQLGAMAACVGHEKAKAIIQLVNQYGDQGAARVAAERH